MASETVVIREFANELDAQLAQAVLDANNIPAAVLRDSAGGMLPVLQVLFPVRLVVRATDAALAIALLDGDVDPSDPEHADGSDDPENPYDQRGAEHT